MAQSTSVTSDSIKKSRKTPSAPEFPPSLHPTDAPPVQVTFFEESTQRSVTYPPTGRVEVVQVEHGTEITNRTLMAVRNSCKFKCDRCGRRVFTPSPDTPGLAVCINCQTSFQIAYTASPKFTGLIKQIDAALETVALKLVEMHATKYDEEVCLEECKLVLNKCIEGLLPQMLKRVTDARKQVDKGKIELHTKPTPNLRAGLQSNGASHLLKVTGAPEHIINRKFFQQGSVWALDMIEDYRFEADQVMVKEVPVYEIGGAFMRDAEGNIQTEKVIPFDSMPYVLNYARAGIQEIKFEVNPFRRRYNLDQRSELKPVSVQTNSIEYTDRSNQTDIHLPPTMTEPPQARVTTRQEVTTDLIDLDAATQPEEPAPRIFEAGKYHEVWTDGKKTTPPGQGELHYLMANEDGQVGFEAGVDLIRNVVREKEFDGMMLDSESGRVVDVEGPPRLPEVVEEAQTHLHKTRSKLFVDLASKNGPSETLPIERPPYQQKTPRCFIRDTRVRVDISEECWDSWEPDWSKPETVELMKTAQGLEWIMGEAHGPHYRRTPIRERDNMYNNKVGKLVPNVWPPCGRPVAETADLHLFHEAYRYDPPPFSPIVFHAPTRKMADAWVPPYEKALRGERLDIQQARQWLDQHPRFYSKVELLSPSLTKERAITPKIRYVDGALGKARPTCTRRVYGDHDPLSTFWSAPCIYGEYITSSKEHAISATRLKIQRGYEDLGDALREIIDNVERHDPLGYVEYVKAQTTTNEEYRRWIPERDRVVSEVLFSSCWSDKEFALAILDDRIGKFSFLPPSNKGSDYWCDTENGRNRYGKLLMNTRERLIFTIRQLINYARDHTYCVMEVIPGMNEIAPLLFCELHELYLRHNREHGGTLPPPWFCENCFMCRETGHNFQPLMTTDGTRSLQDEEDS